MAVFTHLSKSQIENFLLESSLVDLVDFEGILQGVDNTNYKIETATQKLILTVFENRIDRKDIPYFIAFMKFLSEHDITCPAPVYVGEIEDKIAATFTFLDGHDTQMSDITPDLCHELGTLLAKMHLLGQKFSMTRENSMSFESWQTRFHKIGTVAKDYLSQLKIIKENWPKDLPKGSIHADLFPDNVFIKDGHIHGVIDFYFSCTDYLAYDLAIVMNAWCFDETNSFSKDRWAALLSAYEDIRPLTDAEKSAYQTLCQGAAMRFLSSRLHDLTFHDPKNLVTPKSPAEYIQKLEFHTHAKLF